MIDIRDLRTDPEGTIASLARRGDPSLPGLLRDILALDARRRTLLATVEARKAERNAATEEVARRKRAGIPADDLVVALRGSGDVVRALDAEVRGIDGALEERLLTVPNIPDPASPDGTAEANRVTRTWGTPRSSGGGCRPHWDLGESLGILDLPRGAKIAGSGFPLYRGLGARLVRSLASFMIDLHTEEHGYVEVLPPYLVNRGSLQGTGQLPKFAEEVYHSPADDLYLIPTAEVPVTNIHREEILEESQLPLAYVAWTPCFRREAGAHGKDTRGLIRVHQFDKVELVRLVEPGTGPEELQRITGHAERVLQLLELPYRVVELAAGDTGFSAAHTFDLEVWAPGADAWLEVSSASAFTDFQARRANIRYRPAGGGKPRFVHTLNASGLAFPRVLAALLEVHQQADGSVRLPAPLVPLMRTDRLVPPS